MSNKNVIAFCYDPNFSHDKILTVMSELNIVKISAKKLNSISLEKFDALILASGRADNYLRLLDPSTQKKIKSFVENGGGYLGICAGAYMGTDYAFNFGNTKIVDLQNWARGTSYKCEIEYTNHGQQILGNLGKSITAYINGPIISTLSENILATYKSTYAIKKNHDPEIMRNSPAIVAFKEEKGRVVLVSPHLELGDLISKEVLIKLIAWMLNL